LGTLLLERCHYKNPIAVLLYVLQAVYICKITSHIACA